MRAILAIAALVITSALAWSGFWYWQASFRERAIEDWLAARRAAGWTAEAGDVRVSGFPSRVDVFVTGLNLADPRSGWAWKSDELQILSLAYKPQHVIVALPGQQMLSTAYETVRVQAEKLRGSVLFRPTTDLELDHMTFEIGNMQVLGNAGWSAEIGKAILATRQAKGDGVPPFAQDLALTASEIGLPPELMRSLRAGKVLPAEIGAVSLDSMLLFDRPWDRASVEGGLPALQGVDLRDMHASWGRVDLRAHGDLRPDSSGLATGRLDLVLTNWRDMIDVAQRGGMISETVAGTLRVGLGLIAQLSANRDALEIPLEFGDGQSRLGPLSIGPAPHLGTPG